MDKFEIGEVAIGQNFNVQTEWNGQYCEIIGGLELRTSSQITSGEVTTALRYEVKWADGRNSVQETRFLKKKKPPEISWEELQEVMNWRPEGATV